MTDPTPAGRWRWRRPLALAMAALFALAGTWTWWAESNPGAERQLRHLVSEKLHDWFPQAMAPDDGWHGIHRRDQGTVPAAPPVLLIHGLDEPGDIWDDLAPALAAAGMAVWEFRYPNDQDIARSVAYLAEKWPELPSGQPLALIGHSMGGLVAREFVSHWRHPVETPPLVGGAPVGGVILVGTPNQGSEWARLRTWLEWRDHFASERPRQLDPLAGLRDGLGEAKIDLLPGSDFLNALNARPWPPGVPLAIIAGRLIEPAADRLADPKSAAGAAGATEFIAGLEDWNADMGATLGDGLVSLESARLAAIEPLVVTGSHRGMIRRPRAGDEKPPAIAPILAILRNWVNMAILDHLPP